MQLTGIHYLTAISTSQRENLAFTPACSACGWWRGLSIKMTSRPTICSTPPAKPIPAPISPSSIFRRRPNAVEPTRSRASACVSLAKRLSATGAIASGRPAAHGVEIHVFAMGEASDKNNPAAELHVIEEEFARRAPRRRRLSSRRLPHPGRDAVPRLDIAAERVARANSGEVDQFRSLYFREPCSRSRPMVQALSPTSRWRRSARNWRCRRFWSRDAPAIEAGLEPIR
jgi:hypothetical protein